MNNIGDVLKELCEPAARYLEKNLDPHTEIRITADKIELLSTEHGIPLKEVSYSPVIKIKVDGSEVASAIEKAEHLRNVMEEASLLADELASKTIRLEVIIKVNIDLLSTYRAKIHPRMCANPCMTIGTFHFDFHIICSLSYHVFSGICDIALKPFHIGRTAKIIFFGQSFLLLSLYSAINCL